MGPVFVLPVRRTAGSLPDKMGVVYRSEILTTALSCFDVQPR